MAMLRVLPVKSVVRSTRSVGMFGDIAKAARRGRHDRHTDVIIGYAID